MPWAKGQSGNPKGAPKRANSLARIIRDGTNNGEELVQFALRLLRGEETVKVKRVVRQKEGPPTVVEMELPAPLEARIDARNWLADRGWGKAVETIEVVEDGSGASAIGQPDEALEAGLGPEGTVQ